MARNPVSIEQRLMMMQLALDTLETDNTIQTKLASFSYDNQRRAQGRQLYAEAVSWQQQQQAAYGEQYSATDTLDALWNTADAEYMRLVKIARIALKDHLGLWTTLSLVGKRKQQLAGWLLQARQFYDNALTQPTVMAQFGVYGISAQQLMDGREQINAVEAANVAQKCKRGEAQEATLKRDAALDAMDAWYSELIGLARVALDDAPQQLEKFGLMIEA